MNAKDIRKQTSQAGALRPQGEHGFSILEVITSVLLLSIVGVGFLNFSIMTLETRHKAINDYLALQLALERVEQYAPVDPLTLNNGDQTVESVTRGGKDFTRTSTVTVNADSSRTIEVSIVPVLVTIGGTATASDTFTSWEAQ